MVNGWGLGKSAENQFINGKIILWLKLFKTILKRVCLKNKQYNVAYFYDELNILSILVHESTVI